jgi:hypothetical protein
MATATQPLSIRVTVTTDDPRTEAWNTIWRDLLASVLTPIPTPASPPRRAAVWSDPIDPIDDATPEDFDPPMRPRGRRRAVRRADPH